MNLRTLKLSHFKTHEAAEFQFEAGINAITGINGAGKTNLLDSIHHLSFGRSAFHKQDMQSVSFGAEFYRLDARLQEESEKSHRLELIYSADEKKKLIWDGELAEKIGPHIGRLPLVCILPEEPYEMNESGEWRRSFVDNTLSQAFPEYLRHLSRYKKILSGRNALLKYFAERQSFDSVLMDTVDQELSAEAIPVWEIRKRELPAFIRMLEEQYGHISDGAESAGLIHEFLTDSSDLVQVLLRNRMQDLEARRTLAGPHRDDFIFQLNGRSLKKTGSQGQQKSFLLSLKLAQYQFLKQKKDRLPWLLMDDIFDKLDDLRISRLIKLVSGPGTGQVFLTDARFERTHQILKVAGVDFQEIRL